MCGWSVLHIPYLSFFGAPVHKECTNFVSVCQHGRGLFYQGAIGSVCTVPSPSSFTTPTIAFGAAASAFMCKSCLQVQTNGMKS